MYNRNRRYITSIVNTKIAFILYDIEMIKIMIISVDILTESLKSTKD